MKKYKSRYIFKDEIKTCRFFIKQINLNNFIARQLENSKALKKLEYLNNKYQLLEEHANMLANMRRRSRPYYIT